MIRPSDRRRRPSVIDLRTALHVPPIVDQERFESLLNGWIELGDLHLVEVSLLLVRVIEERVLPATVVEVLNRNLRLVDVVGRRIDGTYALLVDADATGARRVAERVKQALEAEGAETVVGVVTVAPGQARGQRSIEVAVEALGAAHAAESHGIEVATI